MSRAEFSSLLWCACTVVLLLLGCSDEPTPTLERKSALLDSDTSNYPVAMQSDPVRHFSDGSVGTMKIVAGHWMNALDEDEGNFCQQALAVKGTGNLIVADGQWLVVTARHNVVPRKKLEVQRPSKDPEDEKQIVECECAEVCGVRIALGHLAVQPSNVWISRTLDDVAVLTIADEDRDDFLVAVDEFGGGPIPLQTSTAALEDGYSTVEALGYPAKHARQIEANLRIGDQTDRTVTLNRALGGGYSGGPVLSATRSGDRAIIGMVTRADPQSNQSTVIKWSVIQDFVRAAIEQHGFRSSEALLHGNPDKSEIFKRIRSGSSETLLHTKVPGEVQYEGRTIRFNSTF